MHIAATIPFLGAGRSQHFRVIYLYLLFLDASAERRTEERSQISTQYTETVSKLIHNLGEIEQIATNDMYTEQSWVEQLLKRVRNEADSATKGMF